MVKNPGLKTLIAEGTAFKSANIKFKNAEQVTVLRM